MLFRKTGEQDPVVEFTRTGAYYEILAAMEDVKQYAKSHGGDIGLVGLTEDGDVVVQFIGACKSCPLSTITLKTGVEAELRKRFPSIRKVIAK